MLLTHGSSINSLSLYPSATLACNSIRVVKEEAINDGHSRSTGIVSDSRCTFGCSRISRQQTTRINYASLLTSVFDVLVGLCNPTSIDELLALLEKHYRKDRIPMAELHRLFTPRSAPDQTCVKIADSLRAAERRRDYIPAYFRQALEPYFRRRDELTMDNGCVMLGS